MTMPAGPIRWHRLILLFVFGLIGTANAFTYLVRLTEPAPLSPWEPAIAMEAVRFAEGLPLYETAHASHMYGPLLTAAIAGIFKVTGFSLLAVRIVFSLCGLTLAAFLAILLSRGEWRWWVGAFILFTAVNMRAGLSLVSAQAEGVAALLAVIALWLWARPKSSPALRTVALLFFLAAVLFKQTSAVFALILPVNAVFWGRPFDWRKPLIASIPTVAIGLMIALIYLAAPLVFQAMIAVPASIHVSLIRAVSGAILLLTLFPIFYLGAAALFIKRGQISEMDRYICSSVAVLVPAAVWTFAKSGGSSNSFLYAYLAMAALVASQFPSIVRWVESLPAPRIHAATIVVAIALFGSYFFQFKESLALLSARHGDERIDAAIAIARQSGVISPEDPSIAYRGNGHLGRAVFFELDAHAIDGEWPAKLPAGMGRELDRARGVIEVHGYVPLPLFRQTLIEKEFRPVSVPALDKSTYTLWLRPDHSG